MKYFLILIFSVTSYFSFGNNVEQTFFSINEETYKNIELTNTIFLIVDSSKKDSANVIKTKLIAVTLAITLGAFGVHRLYLGTKPLVPIAYTLTLGGGMGLLPIIDIIYIITTKDINSIRNNNHVFIWNKNRMKK